MRGKGTLIILATNSFINEHLKSLEILDDPDKLMSAGLRTGDGTVLLTERYALYDSRNSQSKNNRNFREQVKETLKRGTNIIIVVPNAMHVDKSIREKALILELPKKEKRI